jgi:single-strand DNA-binding protein
MLKTLVIGHLGKDATVNTVNGNNVVNFSVAHTEKWRDNQGNNQEKTTWVECSYWAERVGVAPYLTKGVQVYCEGTPEVRMFTRSDRSAGASLTLRVHKIELLGGKREGNNTQGGQQQQRSNFPQDPANNWGNQSNANVADDLPF